MRGIRNVVPPSTKVNPVIFVLNACYIKYFVPSSLYFYMGHLAGARGYYLRYASVDFIFLNQKTCT